MPNKPLTYISIYEHISIRLHTLMHFYAGDLEVELCESERLLGEIATVTKEDAPDIVAMGTSLTHMEAAVVQMEADLKK